MAQILVASSRSSAVSAVQGPLIQLAHHHVQVVKDGGSALSALKKRGVDLALLDLTLDGLDGAGVCRQVRREGNPLPVVLLVSSDEDLQRALGGSDPGADEYLVLPLSDTELVARVGAVLRSRQMTEEMRRHSSELEIKVVEHAQQMEEMASELRVERDALRETFNFIEDGLLLVDATGRILVTNTSGRTLREGKFVPAGQDAPSQGFDEMLVKLAASAAKGERPPALSFVHLQRHLSLRAHPAAGKRALVYVRDVTHERDEEVRRLQAEKLASIGMLAAGVAHEINNPASFVLANLDALNSLMAAIEEQLAPHAQSPFASTLSGLVFESQSILQESKEGMARIYRIVRDLHSFSRVDDDDRALTPVNDAIESSLSLMRNELRYSATVERDLQATLCVRGGGARLGQVFVNLVVNAAHAMSDGGPKRNRLWVRSRDEGDHVVVEVQDNGPGMSAEVKARIFDSFFTTKARGVGTGLGLSISRDIVQSLGGTIDVESRPGDGALFRIRMPATRNRVACREEESEPLLVRKRRRILAIDDEALLLKAYRRMMSDHHDVETKHGGHDALAYLGGGASVDVILCDLQMPEMSGAQFFDQVMKLHPHLVRRFIFVTGGAFSPDTKQFLLTSDAACINKPFQVRDLLDLIERRAMESEG